MNLLIGRNNSIHYLEFGKGEPLVLVPSLWVTSKSYVALGQALGTQYHVFIPDLYRGKSEFSGTATSIEDYVAMLGEFIRRLHLSRYYLIGVSLSGIVATKYVLNKTNLPIKLLLVSSTVLPLNIKNPRRTLFWGYLMLLYHNMFSIEGLAVNWLWITDGLENVWRHFRQAWTEGLIATSLEIKDVKRLPVPTKLIFALRDEFIPREAFDRSRTVKNLELEAVDGYHGWFFRHEQELVTKIFKFFDV